MTAHSEVEGLLARAQQVEELRLRSDTPSIYAYVDLIRDLAAALRSLSVQPEVERLREALRETDLAVYPYPGDEGGCIVSGGDSHDAGVCEVCALHERNVLLLDSQRTKQP